LAVTRFASRNDQRLSYETSGEGEGMPVLALHDLLVDRGQLRPLASALSETPPSSGGGLGGGAGGPSSVGGLGREAGFRVVLPDARGHGASPMIGGHLYTATELAADALAILDAERLTTIQVVAVGWGANIALALAAAAPRRVHSLALISPYLPPLLLDHPVGEAKQYGAALQEAIAEAASAAGKGQIDRALDVYLGVRWGSGWRERLSKPRLGAIRRAAANLGPLLAGLAPEQLDRDALRAIDCPLTQFVRADAPPFERWNAEALSLLIPRSGVQTVSIGSEDEGHAVLTPDWAAVLARVLATQRA
jgi:pimeloyl-ACP methyl ester carboxylesterase